MEVSQVNIAPSLLRHSLPNGFYILGCRIASKSLMASKIAQKEKTVPLSYREGSRMVDRDDEAWIAELKGQEGEQKQETAFQDLGHALLPLVKWYLSSRSASPPTLAWASYHDLDQLAQDIVQESLVRIWQRGLNLYRGDAKFITFAKAIAINQARQKLRGMWRRPEMLLPSPDDDGMSKEDDEKLSIAGRSKMVMAELPPEKRVMLREALRCVDRLLATQCSSREREAFVRKYLDGLKSKEIAQLMNTTDRAVNLLTYNARQKLRQGLEEERYTLEVLLEMLRE
jgi:RNA polymerase sigma factor (sigma-70 family)